MSFLIFLTFIMLGSAVFFGVKLKKIAEKQLSDKKEKEGLQQEAKPLVEDLEENKVDEIVELNK